MARRRGADLGAAAGGSDVQGVAGGLGGRLSGEDARVSRREFLHGLSAVAALPLGAAQDSLSGRGDAGTLRDPTAAGRSRQPTVAADFDGQIKAIEQRLACSCGCTLDIFTCRTTDFTCTYSPRLHREVVAMHQAGKSAQEIIDAFVAEYGEKALMAPKAEGFNLWGYLLPGTLITAAGAGLFAFISRRRARVAASGEAVRPEADAPPAGASEQEMERLRRALAEVED